MCKERRADAGELPVHVRVLLPESYAASPDAHYPVLYLFHGTSGRYHGLYGNETLKGWAEWCGQQRDQGRSVWCYFNNDIHGHALQDARDLKALLKT